MLGKVSGTGAVFDRPNSEVNRGPSVICGQTALECFNFRFLKRPQQSPFDALRLPRFLASMDAMQQCLFFSYGFVLKPWYLWRTAASRLA